MNRTVLVVFSVVAVYSLAAQSSSEVNPPEKLTAPTAAETAAPRKHTETTTPKSAALKRAERLFFSKKYETAAALLRKIVDDEPENGRANSLLGDVYYLQGQYEKAVSHLLRAVELNENKALDYFRLGQTYTKLKKSKAAISAFLKAYEADDAMKTALFHTGFVYLSLERNKQKTIDYWQRFVDEAHNDPQREKVVTVLKFLRDPNFVLPDKNSPISLEEALMIGGTGNGGETKTGEDKGAGYEKAKEKNDSKELLDDDKLN
ncbi:MAG: CDC27 family protein [Spirochaetes bacterium]|nr:CDC27 family protein [Spirochaetota bacterium]